MELLRAARKLVLGETWVLPAGIAVAVGICALVRVAAGPHGWFAQGGGFVLLGCVAVAYAVATRVRR